VRKWILTAIAVAALSLVAACGGGDDDTIDIGDGEVSIGDDLPDNFPDDFPIYDGADLEGAVTGESEGIEGTVATWTTGDDLADVVAFYDDAFTDGPWTSSADGTAGGGSFWAVENEAGDKAGYVQVAGADDGVSIVATVGDNPDASADSGDDEGDGDEPTPDSDGPASDPDDSDTGDDPGSADLPEEVDLSAEFPTDQVPLPDDIRITSSSSVNAGGVQSHIVAFYSQDSADELAAHFKTELEGNGYTQSIETSDENGSYAAYAENEDGTGAIVIVTITESSTEGYQEVGVQVTEGQ
jgi:hypothetical protein